jgi:uncharacterized membrane protein
VFDRLSTDETLDAVVADTGRLRAPLIVIGVGLGGFVDGIVLHQVLQAHHMLSNTGDDRLGLTPRPVDTVEGLEVNTLWDGLFHVTAYLFVLAGLLWLWQRWRSTATDRAPWRLLIGGLLAGWGVFNLVEGVGNHHLLAIHHVYDDDLRLLWDLLFLASGAALLGVGLRLMGDGRRRGAEASNGSRQ